MATETLLGLRTRIRQRTDTEHTTGDDDEFMTDTELNQLINKSYRRLFGLLVKSGLQSVAETMTTITGTGAALYALPDDFLAVQDVYRVEGSHRPRLGRHNPRHRPSPANVGIASTYRTFGTGANAQIELSPRPGSGTYEVYYIAIPTALAADGDTVDGVIGWEEYIVVDCAIHVLSKIGLPTQDMRLEKAGLEREIAEEAAMRDLHESVHIVDVRARSGLEGLADQYGFLPGGYRGVFPDEGW